jgi:hypothetical protein
MSTKTSAPAEMEGIIEAFDEISGLCRHLRQGGPVPDDLQELSDALHEAVDIAANMLHAITQQPAARGDVLGLVAKLAAHVRPTCSELWDEAQAFLAAKGKQAGKVKLSYNDLCRLSSVFNDHSELHLEQDRRINEWISERIAESLAGERNGYQRPTYSE